MHLSFVGVLALGVGIGGSALCGAWWLWWRLPKRQVDRLSLKIRDAKARADVEDNFRKTISQLLGGATVLLGAGFAYLQFSQQQQASHELLISNQVAKGFEQLGSGKVVVRLGGIYALEGVMSTSEQYHQPVLEALSASVRDRTRAETDKERPATDIQAALTVIGRRATGDGRVDLTRAHIPQANLFNANLGDAYLIAADLSGAILNGAILNGAILNGANLNGADLSSADLSGANLSGANLSIANLRQSGLGGANLNNAHLNNAHLNNAFMLSASLAGASLRGVDLSDAILKGAILNGADLSGANLSDANLSEATVSQTQLDHACGVGAKLPPGLNLNNCNSSK